ncbi:hypothetical protein KP509_21G020100 [Ceratopteris richardii]|uniref:Uncharacterized protein n=2 Tax=Ceratopteris richardii TaxID=49495 RepID=A0A8T2S880_CERRI|nr:hypothetical protein KP509_21G020100 [Ceratopteris richardii]
MESSETSLQSAVPAASYGQKDEDFELTEDEVWEVASLQVAAANDYSGYGGTASWPDDCEPLALSLRSADLQHSVSSAIAIPEAAKKISERTEENRKSVGNMNVAVHARQRRRRSHGDEQEESEEDSIVPPHLLTSSSHEVVAIASSLMEGAGRTLKGRDLRNVRNSVWKQLGFFG